MGEGAPIPYLWLYFETTKFEIAPDEGESYILLL